MPGRFRYDLIPRGAKVLCALSGGADSMYLLCRLLEGAERGGYTVRCAHYNHHLRDTADRDEAFVRDWCAAHDIPLTVGAGDVAAQAQELGFGVEACAREMRYAFLNETARVEGCTLIATGHHAGDNAETILMNLLRGCGLKGLTGIPERRGNIIRPMLAVSRGEIDAYLAAYDVSHMEDETNGDQSYTRNRVRHQLIPLLEGWNPGVTERLNQLAASLKEDEEELSRQGERLASRAETRGKERLIPAAALAQAPRPIALRAIRRLMEQADLGVSALQLERALALAGGSDPSARLDVPGGVVRREYDRLVFAHIGERAELPAMPLAEGTARWGEWSVCCAPAICPPKGYLGPGEFYLKPGEYVIRPRREGDEVRLGRRPSKTVKKLMIEEKIPAHRRDRVPVIDRGGAAAALGGFGPDAEYLAQEGRQSLHIILTEEKEL